MNQHLYKFILIVFFLFSSISSKAQAYHNNSQKEKDGISQSELKTALTPINNKLIAHDEKIENLKNSAIKSLIKADSAKKESKSALDMANTVKTKNGVTNDFIDKFWILLAAVLVFFMQAGFKCLEVGVARISHNPQTAIMNLLNWLILCITFYFIGFSWMFGLSEDYSGVISNVDYWGTANHVFSRIGEVNSSIDLTNIQRAIQKLELLPNKYIASDKYLGIEFFLFQLAFAGTTATIVDGAILERTSLIPYFLMTFIVGLFIYPIFGAWAWGVNGWLNTRHFHDFAGSTVVHSVGAWAALIAILIVGNRRFKFNDKAPVSAKKKIVPFNLGYSILGVIMLWFGWWGFNGGSTLKFNDDVASIILNTNLAGASAGIIALIDAYSRDKEHLYEKFIGGVLGGLVAITASCDVVNPLGATIIGLAAGIVHNLAYDYLITKKIDDVAGAIPVHGACGVLGTLLVAFIPYWFPFNDNLTNITKKILLPSQTEQLGIQLLGITVAGLYTSLVAWITFSLIDRFIGFRISIKEEDGNEEILSEVIDDYHGSLRFSVRRTWNNKLLAWSNFMNHTDFSKTITPEWDNFTKQAQKLKNKSEQAKLTDSFSKLQENYVQIIRDDDTQATLQDVLNSFDIIPRQIFINYRRHYKPLAFLYKNALINKLLPLSPFKFKFFIDAHDFYAGSKLEGLEREIINSEAMLVLIDEDWMKVYEYNVSKLQTDWTSTEIELALKHNIKLIPLRINNTSMPLNLPKNIRKMADYASESITDSAGEDDIKRILRSIDSKQ